MFVIGLRTINLVLFLAVGLAISIMILNFSNVLGQQQNLSNQNTSMSAVNPLNNQTSAISWKTYSNPVYALKINYPANWVVKEDRKNVRFLDPLILSAKIDGPNLHIDLIDLETNQTLEKILRDAISDSQSTQYYSKNITITDTKKVKLANGMVAGEYVTSEVTGAGENLKTFTAIATNNGLEYYFYYYTHPENFEKGMPIVRAMLDSFEPVGF